MAYEPEKAFGVRKGQRIQIHASGVRNPKIFSIDLAAQLAPVRTLSPDKHQPWWRSAKDEAAATQPVNVPTRRCRAVIDSFRKGWEEGNGGPASQTAI